MDWQALKHPDLSIWLDNNGRIGGEYKNAWNYLANSKLYLMHNIKRKNHYQSCSKNFPGMISFSSMTGTSTGGFSFSLCWVFDLEVMYLLATRVTLRMPYKSNKLDVILVKFYRLSYNLLSNVIHLSVNTLYGWMSIFFRTTEQLVPYIHQAQPVTWLAYSLASPLWVLSTIAQNSPLLFWNSISLES